MSRVEPYFSDYSTILMTDVWESAPEFLYDYKHVGIPTTISDANATTLFYLLYARYGNSALANYDITQFKYKMFSIVFQYGPTWEKKLEVQATLRGLNLSDLMNDGAIDELFNHSGQNGATETTTDSLNKSTTNTGTQTLAHTGTVGVVHDNDITNSGNDTTVNNHAFNPGTAPANDAYDPLTYINEQNAQKVTKGTKSEQDESSTTTYGNTDTTTNNLAGAEATNATGSKTISGTDSIADTRKRSLTKGKLAAYEHLLSLLDSDVTGDFINKFKFCFKQFIMPERPLLYVTEDDEEE